MREITVSSVRPATRCDARMDIAEYLEYVGGYLDAAGRRKTDIACLPEVFADQGPAAEHAEVVPGPISEYVMGKAREHHMHVIASLVEKVEDRKYISALVIDGEGEIIGRYHKTHLVPVGERERMGVSPGESLPVFDTAFGKIGMMICFDLTFPEVAAVLARKGAEVIFFPSQMNTPDPGAFELWLRARALDNGVYVVTSTHGVRRGEAGESAAHYRTYVVGPDGGIIASSGTEEGVVTAVVDLDRKWMVTGHGEIGTHDMRRIVAKHRRPDLYRREDID